MKTQNDNEMSKEIIEKIMKKVKKPVSFKYPGDEGSKNGYLIDRVVVRSNPGSRGVPYWDVVDRIEFPGEPSDRRIWIRFGYYRKPKSGLVWGSQTTITEPVATWKRILVKAAREMTWFRDLLEDVMKELRNGEIKQ